MTNKFEEAMRAKPFAPNGLVSNMWDSFMKWRAGNQLPSNGVGIPAGLQTGYSAQVTNGAVPGTPVLNDPYPGVVPQVQPATSNIPVQRIEDTSSFIPSIPQQQQPYVVGNTVAPTVNNTTQAGLFNPQQAPASFSGYGSRQYTEGLLQDQSDLSGLNNINAGDTGFSFGSPSSWNWDGIGTGLNLANQAFNAYLGYEQLQQGKEQLAFTKDAWQKNYEMQRDAYDREVSAQESRHAKWNPVGG